ncbi:MAG: hypothetical protein H6600_04640 [Flavobacteriales bacterium]|nr:hypothetical protein [Flavobacteriales bacterium]MCB9196744.1 hypothetical protein [Flavobacteriales bacterium]MCB9197723.1 hypothetical protein [Flavobacteriales bacterium]
MKRSLILLTILLILGVLGCRKDVFIDDLAPIEGRYDWKFNYYLELVGLGYEEKYRYPSQDDFEASFEFGERNRVTFIIDGEEFVKRKFKILSKEIDEMGRLNIKIKVDVNSSDLDINDELEIIYFNDTIIIDKFPHSGYTGTNYGQNYFVRQ